MPKFKITPNNENHEVCFSEDFKGSLKDACHRAHRIAHFLRAAMPTGEWSVTIRQSDEDYGIVVWPDGRCIRETDGKAMFTFIALVKNFGDMDGFYQGTTRKGERKINATWESPDILVLDVWVAPDEAKTIKLDAATGIAKREKK